MMSQLLTACFVLAMASLVTSFAELNEDSLLDPMQEFHFTPDGRILSGHKGKCVDNYHFIKNNRNPIIYFKCWGYGKEGEF